MQKCIKCGIEKNLDNFYFRKNIQKHINICKECYKKYSKKYYQNHKKELQDIQRQYYQNNKDKVKKYNADYKKNKKNNDNVFKNKCEISNMIRRVFTTKGKYCSTRLRHITGLTSIELYEYLLNTFKNNYGYEWDDRYDVHIDHIEPLANAKDIESVNKLNYYTNLQLLKPFDNMKKWKNYKK